MPCSPLLLGQAHIKRFSHTRRVQTKKKHFVCQMFVICKCQTAVEHILHTYIYANVPSPRHFPVYLSADHPRMQSQFENVLSSFLARISSWPVPVQCGAFLVFKLGHGRKKCVGCSVSSFQLLHPNYETYFSWVCFPFHMEIWHLNIYLRQLVTFYSLYQRSCNGFGARYFWGFLQLPLKFQDVWRKTFVMLSLSLSLCSVFFIFISFGIILTVSPFVVECLDLFPHFSYSCKMFKLIGVSAQGRDGKWGKVVGWLLWAHSFINASGGSLFLLVCRFTLTECCLSFCFLCPFFHPPNFLQPPPSQHHFLCAPFCLVLSVVIGLGGRYKCFCKCIFKCNKIITQLV